ncbi:MAG: hypothetical protein AAB879_01365, partial [Patescibacteria group bacterium]
MRHSALFHVPYSSFHVLLAVCSLSRRWRDPAFKCFFIVVVGLFVASLPVHAATLAAGDLVKGPTDDVYYLAMNGMRFVFPNAKSYFTWYADFSTVKTITT